jgi:hypothetical protein
MLAKIAFGLQWIPFEFHLLTLKNIQECTAWHLASYQTFNLYHRLIGMRRVSDDPATYAVDEQHGLANDYF